MQTHLLSLPSAVHQRGFTGVLWTWRPCFHDGLPKSRQNRWQIQYGLNLEAAKSRQECAVLENMYSGPSQLGGHLDIRGRVIYKEALSGVAYARLLHSLFKRLLIGLANK